MDAKVEVRGIREFQSAIKRVDAELPKELKAAFFGIAQHVVGVAQQRMPHITGTAQGSVRPRATQKGAAIAFGGSAAPYMPWLDFGGSVGQGHVPGVAWSGSVKREWMGVPSGSGRYVYPAIKESWPEIEKRVDDAVRTIAGHAGFETREREV